MNHSFQVQVVRRGVITLPKELRDHNNIVEGDVLTLIELGDGVVVMSPRRSRVDEIADKLAKEWKDSGESLESMLSTLREVRTEYDAKKPKSISGYECCLCGCAFSQRWSCTRMRYSSDRIIAESR
jgi:AbrB family looped-hinge helix DNA binding protein